MKKIIPIFILSSILVGCAGVTPSTNVHQPMTAKANPPPKRMNNNGAIYNSGAISFFEDMKPRQVGDTLTVRIVENTNATTKSNNNLSQQSTLSASTPTITGVPGVAALAKIGINADSNQAFNGKGDASNNNQFTGNITVTVIEVLENGNLLVSGEKQVSIGNTGTEYIRLSGVVNPRYVINNEVESRKIADAKVEYKNSGQISEALYMPWLARFFMSLLPF